MIKCLMEGDNWLHIEYMSRYTIPQKSCVNKKRVPIAVDGGLQKYNRQLMCFGTANIETVIVQKSKKSSLMKNVT